MTTSRRYPTPVIALSVAVLAMLTVPVAAHCQTVTDAFFLGREDARPKAGTLAAAQAVAPPPADICTGPYFFQRTCDAAWLVGWPNDWQNSVYYGCAAHTFTTHDVTLGRDPSMADQDSANSKHYAKVPLEWTFAAGWWKTCDETPLSMPAGYQDTCAKPELPGTQTMPGRTLAQVTDPSKKASWTATFHCGAAPTPVPTPAPGGDPGAQYIEALAAHGVTAGCGNGNFCPDRTITRREVAVWIVKAMGWALAACKGTFADVPCQ